MEKESWNKLLLYLGIIGAAFFCLPLMVFDFSMTSGMQKLILLFVYPMMCCVLCLMYTLKYGFSPILPVGIILLFALSALFYDYNSATMMLAIVYGIMSLMSCATGYVVRKFQKNKS